MKTCSICSGKYYCNGFCRKHYDIDRWQKIKNDPVVFAKYLETRKEYLKTAKAQEYRKNITKVPRTRFCSARSQAKRRGIKWEISFEQFLELLKLPCHYCSLPLKETTGNNLDRKDNNGDYTIENVATCCKACNQIKGPNLTYTEMVEVSSLLKKLRNID